MRILAIDPGPEQSAWCLYDTDIGLPIEWATEPSRPMCDALALRTSDSAVRTRPDVLVIEGIASYGMPVGAEVFSTCIIIGRLWQAWRTLHGDPELIYRLEVKTHLCHSAKASDSNIRQALIDRFGPGKEKAIGLKNSPGPLYKMDEHCRSALAVALTYADTRLELAAAA